MYSFFSSIIRKCFRPETSSINFPLSIFFFPNVYLEISSGTSLMKLKVNIFYNLVLDCY